MVRLARFIATPLLRATVRARAMGKVHATATRLTMETTASTFSAVRAKRTVFATILLATVTAFKITTAIIATFSAMLRLVAPTASAVQMDNAFASLAIMDLAATLFVPLITANLAIATRLLAVFATKTITALNAMFIARTTRVIMARVTHRTARVFAMTSTSGSSVACIVSPTPRAMAMASAVLKDYACATNFISEKIAV